MSAWNPFVVEALAQFRTEREDLTAKGLPVPNQVERVKEIRAELEAAAARKDKPTQAPDNKLIEAKEPPAGKIIPFRADQKQRANQLLATKKPEDFRVSNLLKLPPPILNWLLEGSLLKGNFGLVVGPPGTGKSFLMLQLLAAIASGKGLFGNFLKPYDTGKVLAIFCEEDEVVLQVRVRSVVDRVLRIGCAEGERDKVLELIEENMFPVHGAGDDWRLMESDQTGFKATDTYEKLVEFCKRIDDLALIVLDPLSRLYGHDENNNSSATFFCSLLERLAKETGAAVLCVHHTNKASSSKSSKELSGLHPDALRGAGAFVGASRWQLNLSGMTGSKAKRDLKLDDKPKDNEFISVKVSKKNYGPPENTFYLKRGEGGYLEFFDDSTVSNEMTKTLNTVSMIVDEAKRRFEQSETEFTKTELEKEFSKHLKEHGHNVTQKSVLEAANAAVKMGSLQWLEKPAPGSNKPCNYLCLVR